MKNLLFAQWLARDDGVWGSDQTLHAGLSLERQNVMLQNCAGYYRFANIVDRYKGQHSTLCLNCITDKSVFTDRRPGNTGWFVHLQSQHNLHCKFCMYPGAHNTFMCWAKDLTSVHRYPGYSEPFLAAHKTGFLAMMPSLKMVLAKNLTRKMPGKVPGNYNCSYNYITIQLNQTDIISCYF